MMHKFKIMNYKSLKKFDMKKDPHRPLPIIKHVFWLAPLVTNSLKTKIEKVGFKDFKEPSLIIMQHQSEKDFGSIQKAMFPYVPVYVSATEEFIRGETFMKMVGTIPKIKWTRDIRLLLRMRRVIKKFKCSVAIFPEAKWSACGITEQFSEELGKTAKFLDCRVIVMQSFGNYLNNPFWQYNKFKNKKLVSKSIFHLVCTKEESQTLSSDEIQSRINKYMEYDEYKYQLDNHIEIKSDNHLQDVEGIIYKCPDCNSFGTWTSKGNTMKCKNCGLTYRMDNYGELHLEKGKTKFRTLSDLYRWEKEETKKEIYNDSYYYEDNCDLWQFINGHKGFIKIGQSHFIHDKTGLTLDGTLDNGEKIYIHKNPIDQESIHVAPMWNNKGPIINFSTNDDIFFLLPRNKKRGIWKIMHAVEAQYVKAKIEINDDRECT